MRGLYAITDAHFISPDQWPNAIEQAIIGGAQIIQYRDKSTNKTQRLAQAHMLQTLCQTYHIPLIINDDVALAQQVQAAGVHLGKTDADIAQARAILGQQALIGASCYNQVSRAQRAVQAGASYVAFGRFFTSQIKPQAVPADIDLLRHARKILDCPLVAIGGITPDNGAPLIAAGADCLAVIQGVFGQTEIAVVARRYAHLFR
jgi:thiamine-phosphate pyrophosphorylase